MAISSPRARLVLLFQNVSAAAVATSAGRMLFRAAVAGWIANASKMMGRAGMGMRSGTQPSVRRCSVVGVYSVVLSMADASAP